MSEREGEGDREWVVCVCGRGAPVSVTMRGVVTMRCVCVCECVRACVYALLFRMITVRENDKLILCLL